MDVEIVKSGSRLDTLEVNRKSGDSNQVELVCKTLMKQIEIDQPFFIIDLGETDRLYHQWQNQLPDVLPYYSVKCNTDIKMIDRLASLGTSFDCASVKEMELILSRGVTGDRIIFAHPIKTVASLKYAARHGVNEMTFDNADELEKVAAYFPEARLYLRIYATDPNARFRLGDKFGASMLSSIDLLDLAKKLHLNIVGVAFHLGCGVTNGQLYVNAIKDAIHIIKEGAARGHRMTTLDIGGGWRHSTFLEISETVWQFLKTDRFLRNNAIRVIAEPGTYFAESAFTLVCNVIGRRCAPTDEGHLDFLYLDEGIWGSFEEILFNTIHPHPILLPPSEENSINPGAHSYSIWGPTCDSTDKVISSWTFPREVSCGDRMYFENMGAYTTSCATSFNGLHPTRHMIYIDSEQGCEDSQPTE